MPDQALCNTDRNSRRPENQPVPFFDADYGVVYLVA